MEEIFERNNLLKKPNLIFNADKTGMPLPHRPGRRIAVRGQKHVHVLGSGHKTQVTVLACANATGYTMPPIIIYKKNLTTQLRAHEVEGTIYGLSSTGWMDGELLHEWFFSLPFPPICTCRSTTPSIVGWSFISLQIGIHSGSIYTRSVCLLSATKYYTRLSASSLMSAH